jgi:hypothetical protein
VNRHARATDPSGEAHVHGRRWKFDTSHLITLLTSLVSALIISLVAFVNLRGDVESHTREIVRLDQTKETKEAADGKQKEILARLDALQNEVKNLREDIRAHAREDRRKP